MWHDAISRCAALCTIDARNLYDSGCLGLTMYQLGHELPRPFVGGDGNCMLTYVSKNSSEGYSLVFQLPGGSKNCKGSPLLCSLKIEITPKEPDPVVFW